MAFGTTVTHAIFFIGAITVAAGLLLSISTITGDTSSSLSQRQKALSESLSDDIRLTSVSYQSGTLYVYAVNTGTSILEPENIDLFVDGLRIDRSGFSINIETDTSVGQPDLWNPEEVVEITYIDSLNTGQHTVRLQAGTASEEEVFSV